MKLKYISVTVVVCALAAVNFAFIEASFAEEDLSTIEQKLTGGTSRDWVFKQMRRTMGSSDECTQGVVYRFASDHKLVDEQCVNGHIKSETHTWSLERQGPLDVILKIDSKPFVLLFKEEGNALLMRIRQRSASKTEPTVDREFRFEAE
jgi:hypothetical protein